MRVLVVSTSELSGGAAIAASRLTDALNRHGVSARMLVRDRATTKPTTLRLGGRLRLRWSFVWERLRILVAGGFRRRGLWGVDIACSGGDITHTRAFREADVIHLHWVNQGLLSLRELGAILGSGKAVVWTMHDMWPCTGVCHHARECARFHSHCHDCPQLPRPGRHDLSWRVYEQKLRVYGGACGGKVSFVACSSWLRGEACRSALLRGLPLEVIPNTYDADVFHPGPMLAARAECGLPLDGRLLLFACQKVTNPRKGLSLLLDALRSGLLSSFRGSLALVVVGGLSEGVAAELPFVVHRMGYVSEPVRMASLYRAVDVFVTPSLEENLPNTIMEAMACGTPCVGFATGGIPEMITHGADGYVARYGDASDLAAGIAAVLAESEDGHLARAAAAKAVRLWGEAAVARQHVELYERLLFPL